MATTPGRASEPVVPFSVRLPASVHGGVAEVAHRDRTSINRTITRMLNAQLAIERTKAKAAQDAH